ncbi:hypothetical protein D6D05_03945 [Aureobasidium pullulans]|nr:hypothetical protein D6D05_03945 [Aureobasidium pullulans]
MAFSHTGFLGDRMTGKALEIGICATASAGFLLFGYDQGVMSVTGAGNGMNTSSIPVWQSEMAPPKIRGFLVLFEGALITGGVMISYWINYGFWFYNTSSFQWRFPVAFQAFFGIILIIGILAFPKSPRRLLKHGKEKEAA